MWDNTLVHTARLTMNWFNNRGIYVLPNWPLYSPDLNPIEHIWARLKGLLYELHPGVDDIVNKEAQKATLSEYLPEVWLLIQPDVIQGVLDSMPRRMSGEEHIRRNGTACHQRRRRMDRRQTVLELLLDIKRAFDRVNKQRLLRRMLEVGIAGNTVRWVKLFLSVDNVAVVRIETVP
jgi:hypothetical protein